MDLTPQSEDLQQCSECGTLFDKKDMIYGPDPYRSEINDDMTPVWECKDCYTLSLEEI